MYRMGLYPDNSQGGQFTTVQVLAPEEEVLCWAVVILVVICYF